jgi:hypothetical protein
MCQEKVPDLTNLTKENFVRWGYANLPDRFNVEFKTIIAFDD